MEEQKDLMKIGIGNKDSTNLKDAVCKVLSVEIQLVGEGSKANHKVVFELKHPNKEESIRVSSIKHESKQGKLVCVGAWYSLDEDKLINKNSALASCLRKYNSNNVEEMINKDVETVLGEDGYLVIKAY